jgi:hypothetical protein
MSDEKPIVKSTVNVEKKIETPFNVEKAKAKISLIKETLIEKYAGKPGFNPYLWIAKNIRTIEENFKSGKVSSADLKFIQDLPIEPDCSVIVDPIDNNVIEDESQVRIEKPQVKKKTK